MFHLEVRRLLQPGVRMACRGLMTAGLCIPQVGAGAMAIEVPPPVNPITQQQKMPDFSGTGRSGRRIGGGSRSDCPSVDVPLTALVPRSNVGRAIASHPQLWFYVPYDAEAVSIGEFILQDSDRNDIYRANVELPGTPGLVSVTLPETAPELALNQAYRWYLHVYCDVAQSSSPIFVQGWIERVSATPDLVTQLATTSERKDLAYANHQIWFDAIATLATYRMAEPGNSALLTDWQTLLNATGVELELPDTVSFAGPATLLDQR